MSKLNLYNIEQEYTNLTDELIENGGELTPELEQRLEINKSQLETKGRGYAYIVKQLDDEISLIKSEKKRLDALLKSREKVKERLKETLKNAMDRHEMIEIKTDTLKINFRKSEVVEIEDLALLDPSYKTVKSTITANKDEIKKDIKNGVSVQGAILVENRNIQIK